MKPKLKKGREGRRNKIESVYVYEEKLTHF
jgi:hypothetical protein